MKRIIYTALSLLCYLIFSGTVNGHSTREEKYSAINSSKSEAWYEPQIVTTFNYAGVAIDRAAFSYNASGTVKMEFKENYMNEVWSPGYRRNYTYDELDRRLSMMMELSVNGELTNASQNTYTYDDNDNMLSDVAERWINDEWVDNQRTIWTYDENNNNLTKQQAMWSEGEWVNTSGSQWTYDEMGNMLTEITDFKGVGQERKTWTYDEMGNKLSEIKEVWRNNAWLNSVRITWTYDTSGNELTYLYESWVNDSWTNSQRRTNTYDEVGNKIAQLNETWKTSLWVNSNRYTWTYDEHRRIVGYISENYSNDAWLNYERFTYTYDSSDRMLTKVQDKWSTSTAEWTNGSKYGWVYDAVGNLLSEFFELWRNEAWSVSYDFSWDYDENDNSTVFDKVGSGPTLYLYYNNMKSKYNIVAYNATKITATYIDVNAEVVVPVEQVTLSETSVELEAGETFQLEATVSPEDATNREVIWNTSNGSVVKVNESGLVTAISGGVAKITVTTLDGALSASCDVTVKINVVESVILNSNELTMNVSQAFRLEATVLPGNATNKNITWKSSSSAIAMVSNSGLVTAVSSGVATITVTTVDGDHTANCIVTVVVPVTKVTLNRSKLDLKGGETFEFIASINPENATNKDVTWISSNTEVVTINAEGMATAIAAGTATITVMTADGGFTATCSVNVTIPVVSTTLNETDVKMVPNETLQLVATINPANATNKNVIWSSSKTDIVVVDEEGLVTALGVGTAVVTVTTVDGNHTAECAIKIEPNSVSDLNAKQLNIFYTNDNIVINTNHDVVKVLVYNIAGKLVSENGECNNINTSGWNKGIYIVKVMDTMGATVKSEKIAVK